jgi:ribosomal protein S18 acetylase RimI-like enzyme
VAVAGGQVAAEGELAGLYDVFTCAASRGRGIAEALCRHLLASAVPATVKFAYLQVDASNDAARRVYRRLGFEDAYSYHYRSPPAP